MNYYRNNNEPLPRYAMAQYLLGMGPMPPPTNQELAAVHIQQSLNQGAFEHTYDQVATTLRCRLQARALAYSTTAVGRTIPSLLQVQHRHRVVPELATTHPLILVGAASVSLSQTGRNLTYHLPGLEVEIPAAPVAETESTLATAATPIRLEFSIDDVIPGDFLARVCANMDVSRADAKLGWKASTDAKRSLARPLQNDNDVKAAFDYFCPIISSTRRTKKVHMLVVNLVSAQISRLK
jgi:hypothetical protein